MGQPIAPAGAQLAVGTYVHVLSRSPKTVTQVPPLQTGITEATSIRGDGKLRSRRLLPSALQLEFPRAVSRCQKFGLARKGLRAGAARRWAASRVLPNVRSTSILSPPYNSNPHTLQAMTSELLSLIWAGCLRGKKKAHSNQTHIMDEAAELVHPPIPKPQRLDSCTAFLWGTEGVWF